MQFSILFMAREIFKVNMVVTMKIVFWNVASCCLAEVYQPLGESSCYHQDIKIVGCGCYTSTRQHGVT